MSVAAEGLTEAHLCFAKQNANESLLANLHYRFSGRAMLAPTNEYGGCSSIGRAPDCGSGRCGFESHYPPHKKADRPLGLSAFLFGVWVMGLERPTHSKNGEKLRAGEQFLGRGRVHRQQSAVRRTMNCCLSLYLGGTRKI